MELTLPQVVLDYWDLYDEIHTRQTNPAYICIPYRLIINNIFTYLEIFFTMNHEGLNDDDPEHNIWYKFNNIHKLYGYFKLDICRKTFFVWKRFYINTVINKDINLDNANYEYLNSIAGFDINNYIASTYSYVKHIFEYVLPKNILSIRSNVDVLDILEIPYAYNCVNLEMITLAINLHEDHWIHVLNFPNLKEINIGFKSSEINLDFAFRHNPDVLRFYRCYSYPAESMRLINSIKTKKTKRRMNIVFKENTIVTENLCYIIPIYDECKIYYPLMIAHLCDELFPIIIDKFRPKSVFFSCDDIYPHDYIFNNCFFIKSLHISMHGCYIADNNIPQVLEYIKFYRSRFEVYPYIHLYKDNGYDIRDADEYNHPRGYTWRQLIRYLKRELE